MSRSDDRQLLIASFRNISLNIVTNNVKIIKNVIHVSVRFVMVFINNFWIKLATALWSEISIHFICFPGLSWWITLITADRISRFTSKYILVFYGRWLMTAAVTSWSLHILSPLFIFQQALLIDLLCISYRTAHNSVSDNPFDIVLRATTYHQKWCCIRYFN